MKVVFVACSVLVALALVAHGASNIDMKHHLDDDAQVDLETEVGVGVAAQLRAAAKEMAEMRVWDRAVDDVKNATNMTKPEDPGKGKNTDEDKINGTSICLNDIKTDADFDKCRINCDSKYYASNDTRYLSCYKCCTAQINRWSPERCPKVDGRPCNGHGLCDNGMCVCDHLYEGGSCDVARSPREGRIQFAGNTDLAITIQQTTIAAGATLGLGNIDKWDDKLQEFKYSADGRLNLAVTPTLCLTVQGGENGRGSNGMPLILQTCNFAMRKAQKFRFDRVSGRIIWVGGDNNYCITINGEVGKEGARVELEEIHPDAKKRQTWSFSGAGVHYLDCSKSSCNYKDVTFKNAIYLSCFMDTCSDSTPERKYTRENNPPFMTVNSGDVQYLTQDGASPWHSNNNYKVSFRDTGRLDHGIGEYPNSNVTFELNNFREAGYYFNTFRARVGIDNNHGCAASTAGTTALVYLDGKLVSTISLRDYVQSYEIKVKTGSAMRLDLVSRFIGNSCNFLVWGEPRLSNEPEDGTLAVYSFSNSDSYGGPWDGNRYVYGNTERPMVMTATMPISEGDTIYAINSCQMYSNSWNPVYMELRTAPGSDSLEPLVTPTTALSYNNGYYFSMSSQGAWKAKSDGTSQITARVRNDYGSWVTYWNCNLISFIVRNKNIVTAEGSKTVPWSSRMLYTPSQQTRVPGMELSITIPPSKFVWVTLACSLYNTHGTTYMKVNQEASNSAITTITDSNWIVASEVWGSCYSSGVSQGLWRNDGTSPVQMKFYGTYHIGNYQGNYEYCNMIAREVDGTATGSNDLAGYNAVGGSRLTWGGDWKFTDFNTEIFAKAGDVIYVQLACNIWNHAWHHSVMQVAISKQEVPDQVQTLIAGNYLGYYYHGYWGGGSSQGMYKAKKDGMISFAGLYASGYHYTTYVYCTIIANNMGPDGV